MGQLNGVGRGASLSPAHAESRQHTESGCKVMFVPYLRGVVRHIAVRPGVPGERLVVQCGAVSGASAQRGDLHPDVDSGMGQRGGSTRPTQVHSFLASDHASRWIWAEVWIWIEQCCRHSARGPAAARPVDVIGSPHSRSRSDTPSSSSLPCQCLAHYPSFIPPLFPSVPGSPDKAPFFMYSSSSSSVPSWCPSPSSPASSWLCVY